MNVTGILSHDYGSDGAGTTLLTAAGALLPAGFTASVNAAGTVLTIHQVSTNLDVLQISLSNTTDGGYTVTQLNPVSHAAGGDENNLQFTINYVVTDGNGDIATGSFSIDVDDDTPIASAAQVTGTVDEDGVLEGIADAGPGDGIAGGVGDVGGQATVATGSVATLFQSGADEPLTYGFAANAIAVLQGLGLTSAGVALSYAIVADTVTASAPAGNVIFTFQLTAAGNWTFTLVDQLDHAAGNDENDLTINLGAIVQATDRDGDSVSGNANGLVVTVDDDTPIALQRRTCRSGRLTRTVFWKAWPTAGPGDGIAGGTGDVGRREHDCDRHVAALFQSGADEPLTYGFTSQCDYGVASAGPDLGRRCAELCDCCGHGDGVCAGRRRLHVHADPATGAGPSR